MYAGFPKRSCSNKKIERDDDSKKSHPALDEFWSDHKNWRHGPETIASNAQTHGLTLYWRRFSHRSAASSLPRAAGARHFSSESERWVTKSHWSERPAMSGGKCSTFSTNVNSLPTRWWRWRHAAAWGWKCRMATAP